MSCISGKITEMTDEDYNVNTMVKKGQFWKRPTIPDEIEYSESEIVLKIIAKPKEKNHHGMHEVPELNWKIKKKL